MSNIQVLFKLNQFEIEMEEFSYIFIVRRRNFPKSLATSFISDKLSTGSSSNVIAVLVSLISAVCDFEKIRDFFTLGSACIFVIYYTGIRRSVRICGHYRRLVVDEAFGPLFPDFAEGRKIDGAPRGAPGSLLSRSLLVEDDGKSRARFRGASITVFGNFVLRRSELKKISPRVISASSIPMVECSTRNGNRNVIVSRTTFEV